MGENESQYTPPEDEQGLSMEDSPERESAEIIERVTEHSREFDDSMIGQNLSLEEEKACLQMEHWKIGETAVEAIGVVHVPQTFLVARDAIERAISGADIVVNEFAPEALGFYDQSKAASLRKIKLPLDDRFNLEQVRQRYLQSEVLWHIGIFHHEIELLAAKGRKDMAVVDLTTGKDVEAELSGPDGTPSMAYPALYGQVAWDNEANRHLKNDASVLGAAILAAWGLSSFIKGGGYDEGKISRRNFIKSIGLAASGVALGGHAIQDERRQPPPDYTSPPFNKKHEQNITAAQDKINSLRNPVIAASLRRLSRDGYKKIAFIYGVAHIPEVKKYLDEPEKCEEELSANRGLIDQYNPDRYKIFRLAPGENHSERFVASKDMVWKRVDQELGER